MNKEYKKFVEQYYMGLPPIYRDLEGNITIWKGTHKSWLKRKIYRLYAKYVDEPYIPRPINVNVVFKNPLKGDYTIDSIRLMKGNDTANEVYIFNQFGNKIT